MAVPFIVSLERLVSSSTGAQPLLLLITASLRLAGMLVLDKWLGNANGRQAVFWKKPQERKYNVTFIDQGYCFNAGEWDFPDSALRGVYARNCVYAHICGWESFDLREKLREMNGDRDFILRKIQDSFSNTLQPSEFKACLAESPASEADTLARLYLDHGRRRQPRETSARQAIFERMREEFESAGVWRLMRRDIRAADYTRSGDPLKIDCGYGSNGTVKMFHALALSSDVNSVSAVNAAKLLAFSFPRLVEGIRDKEGKQAQLTAVVEDDLPRDDESVSFVLDTLEQQSIRTATLAQMPLLAATAAREMGIM
jgi:hypothetical protein